MCSKTAVAPLDRIKILLQAHNEHYKQFGKPVKLTLIGTILYGTMLYNEIDHNVFTSVKVTFRNS